MSFWIGRAGARIDKFRELLIIGKASDETNEILIVSCNLAELDVVRTHWPFLRDRRIDAFTGITQRYLEKK